jgi:hypothetical protein
MDEAGTERVNHPHLKQNALTYKSSNDYLLIHKMQAFSLAIRELLGDARAIHM